MPAWPTRQLPMTWLTWPPAWTMRCRSSSCSAVWSLLKGSAAPCGRDASQLRHQVPRIRMVLSALVVQAPAERQLVRVGMMSN